MLASCNLNLSAGLAVEKLEWGNLDQTDQILQNYSGGFDLILGADIYILHSSFFVFCFVLFLFVCLIDIYY